MTPPVLAPIVEGHGEINALRLLIYKIIESSSGGVYPMIKPPYRARWGSLVNRPDELERHAEIALLKGGPDARLLLLLDADDRCPAELGPVLLRHLANRFPNRRISVNIANREYESWFIASAEAIARHIGTTTPFFYVPQDIEAVRAAKGWIERYLGVDKYEKTRHQASFSAVIDVPLARRRSPSFNRFCRELERLLVA